MTFWGVLHTTRPCVTRFSGRARSGNRTTHDPVHDVHPLPVFHTEHLHLLVDVVGGAGGEEQQHEQYHDQSSVAVREVQEGRTGATKLKKVSYNPFSQQKQSVEYSTILGSIENFRVSSSNI